MIFVPKKKSRETRKRLLEERQIEAQKRLNRTYEEYIKSKQNN